MLYENYQSPWLDDELNILRDAAGRFFDQEFVPERERWLEQGELDRDAWQKAGQAGLLCAEMPTEYGGGGGDYRHDTVIMEEFIKRGLAGWGNQVHSSIVAPYILHYGSEEQRRQWLPGMASGDLVGAIAMTEPNTGSDLQSVRTTAVRDGDEYVINGAKTYITNGQHADIVVVVAKTDPTLGAKGISLIVVEADSPGFERGRNLKKLGLKQRRIPRSSSSRTAGSRSQTGSARKRGRASSSSCSSCLRNVFPSPRRPSSPPSGLSRSPPGSFPSVGHSVSGCWISRTPGSLWPSAKPKR